MAIRTRSEALAVVYPTTAAAAMALHRFRARALSLILRFPPSLPASDAPPIFSVHRPLSSAAAAASPDSSPSASAFVVEDYLVSRCGLSRAQAVKASKRMSHVGSRSKPDAVLAFLRGTLGVPAASVAALVAISPTILCANVEGTLAPRIAILGGLGLSRDDIVRLISVAPDVLRSRSLGRNLEFWLKELGSFEKLLRILRTNASFICANLNRVMPNLAFLQQCGVNVSEIAGINLYSTRLLTMNLKLLQDAVERVEELGLKRGERMFGRTLAFVAFMSREVVARRMQWLREVGFSENQVPLIVKKMPSLLSLSEQKVQRNVDFLTKEAGVDMPYIAQRPALIIYSLERRLLPRTCLLKVLREQGLLKVELEYYTTAKISEKEFLQKYVLPYKDVAPGLADDYASKCSGNAMDGLEE